MPASTSSFSSQRLRADYDASKPPKPLQAVLFDAYGTLFDVYSVTTQAEQYFPGKAQALATLWRDKQIEYTRLVGVSGRYHPNGEAEHTPPFYQSFWGLTRAALRYACQSLALPLGDRQEDGLMQCYRRLSAFPENQAVLQALRTHGVTTGILSNGDPDMLEQALRSAQLGDLIQHVLSVQPIRRYKTDPAAYALGTQALGLKPAQVLFVSSNSWDVLGATWWGYTTLWVNRRGMPFETLGPKPHFEGRSLHGVLSALQLPSAEPNLR